MKHVVYLNAGHAQATFFGLCGNSRLKWGDIQLVEPRVNHYQNQTIMEGIKKKRLKIKEGDIFTIPIDHQTQGYGQIVKIPDKYSFIMAVFEGRWDKKEPVSLEEIIKKQILFLGFTSDALLFHGRWVIVGNIISNLSFFTMPFFKLGLPTESQKLVNYKLDEIRLATPDEVKLLNYHSSSSPIGYQKALQAHYGLIEYDLGEMFQYKHMVNTLAKLNLLPN